MPTLSNHVLEKQITLKEKRRAEKNNLKLSKFFLMLLIFKWSIENESLEEVPMNFWYSSGKLYGVSRFWVFKLKNLTSEPHELSSNISSELSHILNFQNKSALGQSY